MRKNRNLIFSLILVATALLAVLIKSKIWQKNRQVSEYFDQNTNEACFNDLCLKKENGIWIMNYGGKTALANNEIVDIYFKKIKEIKLTDVISENNKRFAEYGLDKDVVTVKVKDKKLDIGKINSFYDGTYVLDRIKTKIYVIPIILDRDDLTSPNYWIIKDLTNLQPSQISKVTFDFAKTTKVIEPKAGIWANKIWIEKISKLKANQLLSDFVEGTTKIRFLIQTETKQIDLTIGENEIGKKKKVFWATTGGGWYFEINETDYKLLTDQATLLRLR
jgi:hypothetical protein